MTEIALWSPNFSITATIARALMEIEAAKTTIEHTPISLAAEAELLVVLACGRPIIPHVSRAIG